MGDGARDECTFARIFIEESHGPEALVLHSSMPNTKNKVLVLRRCQQFSALVCGSLPSGRIFICMGFSAPPRRGRTKRPLGGRSKITVCPHSVLSLVFMSRSKLYGFLNNTAAFYDLPLLSQLLTPTQLLT